MFERLKDALPDLAVALGKTRDRRAPRALVIPPAAPGSVGDAAMISATVEALRAHGCTRVDLLQVADRAAWDLDVPVDHMIHAGSYMEYGARGQLASIIYAMAGYSDVIMIGADIVDGVYDEVLAARRLFLLDRAARMGLRATVLGSSFSATPAQSCINALRDLPEQVRIFARDELSHERMETAIGREVETSADVVFLLEDAASTADFEAELAWIRAEKARGAQIIAVNANALQEEGCPDLVQGYIRLVSTLMRQAKASAVLVPHDVRGDRSDVTLAEEILRGLDDDLSSRTHLFQPGKPGGVKAVLREADLLITGRMHAAILGVLSGTPAISFAYQGKFEGLYRHLDLDPGKYVFDLSDLQDDQPGLLKACLDALASSQDVRAHILERIPALRALSKKNFEPLAKD